MARIRYRINPEDFMSKPRSATEMEKALAAVGRPSEVIVDDEMRKIVKQIYGTRYQTVDPPEDTVFDNVDLPAHYQLIPEKGVEVIDVVNVVTERFGGSDGYKIGNVLKYLLRAGQKGDALQDLKKAKKYLSWLIGGM